MLLGMLAATAGPAAGQTVRDRGYEAVEQRVGDLDPLAINLRRVESGLREQGGQSSYVLRRPGEKKKMYYVAPGVVAEYDRSDYMWFRYKQREPWRLVQLIPPNTVFHLRLPPIEPEPLPPNAMRSRQLVDASPDLARRAIEPRDPQADYRWARYRAFQRTQRRALLEAIGGLDVGEPRL